MENVRKLVAVERVRSSSLQGREETQELVSTQSSGDVGESKVEVIVDRQASSYSRQGSFVGAAPTTMRRKKMPPVKSVWTSKELRAIFRATKKKSPDVLTPDEFRETLVNMGITAQNTSALRTILEQVDADGDGIIKEEEFVKFLQSISREKLSSKLDKSKGGKDEPKESVLKGAASGLRRALLEGKHVKAAEPVITCRIIDFGFLDRKGQYKCSFDGPFTPDSVQALTDGLESKEFVKWQKHLRWIDVYGSSQDLIHLIHTCENLPSALIHDFAFAKRQSRIYYNTEEHVMEFTTHAMAIENFPYTLNQESKEYVTVTPKGYKKGVVKSAQVSILVFKRGTVITLRSEVDNPDLAALFKDMPEDIKAYVETPGADVAFQSPLAFGLELIREITDMNWQVRDTFKDWKIITEQQIQKSVLRIHSQLIMDLEQMAYVALKITEPWMSSLADLVGSTAVEVSDEKKSKRRVKVNSREEARRFVGHESTPFYDMSENINKLFSQYEFTREMARDLKEFYKNHNDQRMNQTLYLLTTVTTILAPMQLMTGIYGMNFEHMPELGYKYAYLVWWIVALSAVSSVIFFFYWRGFFER